MPEKFTSPEDFVADDSFIHYCFKDNEKDVSYWENWLSGHPEQHENAQKAIKLLHLLSAKGAPDQKLKNWNVLKENRLTSNVDDVPIAISNSPKPRFRRLWVAAVIAVLILGAGAVLVLVNNKNGASSVTYETVSGERRQITLPDQTKVWLNADSKLIFNKKFKQSVKREVTLIGEAYFKVQKDHDRPFIIHANALNIEVLGTEFNVSAYSQSLTTSATLIRGAIQVYLKSDPKDKILLKPKEKFTISNRGKIQLSVMKAKKATLPDLPKVPDFKITSVQNDPLLKEDGLLETAWLDGKLAFRNEDFEALALQLNHKYGVHFHFGADTLKKYQFTGIFTKETLAEVLHALQLTSPSHPFNYRIDGKKVYISN